ncbi:MAG: OsmC family protein [Phycisphaerales bacterium]|nr:MAG: OsmC family protein [Phycisphaerales bacterium]
MSEHRVTVAWSWSDHESRQNTYSRNHEWRFDNGTVVPASAAEKYLGDPKCVDPEEALVAALSGCHMLVFLAIAAKKEITVDTYTDDAVGYLEKNEDGKLAVTRIVLHPKITFGGENKPDEAQLADMHAHAHAACLIANSLRASVEVA